MANFPGSTYAAENLCFNWLLAATQSVENVSAFLAEIPRRFVEDEEGEMWMFRMGGGEVDMKVNATSTARGNRNCFNMDAQVTGFFLTRERALLIGDLMYNALPAGPSAKYFNLCIGDDFEQVVDAILIKIANACPVLTFKNPGVPVIIVDNAIVGVKRRMIAWLTVQRSRTDLVSFKMEGFFMRITSQQLINIIRQDAIHRWEIDLIKFT